MVKYGLSLIVFLIIVGLGTSYSQEGDNPRSNKKKIRETRYKIKNKQGDKIHKGDITGRNKSKKVKKTKRKGKAVTPAPNPYAGRPEKTESKRYVPNPQYFGTPSKSTEKFRKGNISGNKIKYSRSPRSGKSPVHAAPNPYAGRKLQSERTRAKSNAPQLNTIRSVSDAVGRGGKKKKRISPRSASRPFIAGKKVNAYAGRARHGERAFKGDITGRKVRRTKSSRTSIKVIKPTFNPYYARKSKGDKEYSGRKMMRNASISKRGEQKYQGKAAGGHATATKKGENAWRKDITGRDFKRPGDPGIVTGKRGTPLFNAYANKLKGRKKEFKGKISAGGYISATEKGERKSLADNPNLKRRLTKSAPLGNNAGKPIIGRSSADPKLSGFSGRFKGSKKIKGAGGSITKSGWNNQGSALTRRPPGSGTEIAVNFKGRFKKFQLSPGFDTRSSGFQGNVKGNRKPLKGGGSIARNNWNNKKQALVRKDQFRSNMTLSQGNIKGVRKPLKGGGSIARNNWNNNKQALVRKDQFRSNMTLSQGNIKGVRKPLKGGGSIARNKWNNNRQALVRKDQFRSNMTLSQGSIKGVRKPLKGGGSIARNKWNNNRQALVRKDQFRSNMTLSQGNIKGVRKPLKGGGSIARNKWNNNRQALVRKDQFRSNMTLSQGNNKGVRKPLKGGGSISRNNWNNNRQALVRKDQFKSDMSFFQGNLKGYRKPLKGGGSISRSGWNNKGEALRRRDVTIQDLYVYNFQGRFKRFELSPGYLAEDVGNYRGNIKSKKQKRIPQGEGSNFKGRFTRFELSPGYLAEDLGNYRGALKDKRKYQRNPHAHEDALKGIAPKSGASKAMAFQGNFKVKKTYEKGMHPSAKYTTSVKPLNSLDEKNKTFKFRIWWAKLFKKNENQPGAVTDKVRKPRYDPKEKEIWYE